MFVIVGWWLETDAKCVFNWLLVYTFNGVVLFEEVRPKPRKSFQRSLDVLDSEILLEKY